jgi:hypothetical protein
MARRSTGSTEAPAFPHGVGMLLGPLLDGAVWGSLWLV